MLSGVVMRMIDYSDSLLANKYTRFVSIQVMKHASELDLIAYEDPVYYDGWNGPGCRPLIAW